MLDKTFTPRQIETRLYEGWERAGAFACDPGLQRDALHHHDPAAERHRQPAHGPCADLHHPGHADPLAADAGPRRAVAAGHRPCRHRHADGGGAAAGGARATGPPRDGPRGLRRPGLAVEGGDAAAPSPSSCAGSAPRSTGRASASPWTRGCPSRCARSSSTLYRQGLIYRDRRLVNWDPKLQTAISDLEVESREVKGSLWHIRYPIEGAPGEFITVATTRPETMLGDTAVAVHPEDARFAALVGKRAILPLVGRGIPIVADEYSDPEKGTGAVKITPAHDFNDFEVGKRHGLPMPSVLDRRGAGDARRDRRRRWRAVDGVADPDFVRGAGRPGPLRRAQGDRGGAGAARPAREGRAAYPPGAAWRPRRRADRAAADHAVVLQCRGPGEAGDRGGRDRPDRASCRSNGRTRSSPGCATSSPGASPASSGGATRSRPGTRRTAPSSSTKTEAEAQGRGAREITARDVAAGRRTRTCWTPGSARALWPFSARWAGRSRPRSWRATIRATCW